MITAVVNFRLPEGTSLADARAAFESTAPIYREVGGLQRKYYLFDEAGSTGGGVYLFETKAQAEALFDDVWRNRIRDKYGAEPEIRFFETPVIVDNTTEEILA